VPVTVVTLLLSGASGRLAQRIGPRPQLVAGCLLCAAASVLAVRIGPHAGYWTVVLPVALLFGLGLAAVIPPLTASAMNSAPDSLAGLASGVNNAVARVAGLLWIAALPPLTGLIGAAYANPVQFRSSFGQIGWICAAAFACGAVLAAAFITGPLSTTQAPRAALIQTPVPHLACPVAFPAHRKSSDPAGLPERFGDGDHRLGEARQGGPVDMVKHAGAHAAQVNRVGPLQRGQAFFRQGHVEAAAVFGVALLGHQLAGDELVDQPGGPAPRQVSAVGQLGNPQFPAGSLGQVQENAVGSERDVRAALQVLIQEPRRDDEEAGEGTPGGFLDGVQWRQFLRHQPSLVAHS
jgi:MFS family permease